MRQYQRDDIFKYIKQVQWSAAGGEIRVPIFYRDAAAMLALFPARLAALKALMPDTSMRPAQILPGVGALALGAMEYRDTDIGAHNELSLAVVLNRTDTAQVPGYNLLRQLMDSQISLAILHLPVTTEMALASGVQMAGFPRFLAAIEFRQNEAWRVCEVSQDQEHICTLRCRPLPALQKRLLSYHCHLWQNGQPQGVRIRVNALEYALALGRGNVELELGDTHSVARELSGVLLSQRALMYQYIPSMQAVLSGPENLQPWNLKGMLWENLGFQLGRPGVMAGEKRQHQRQMVDLGGDIDGTSRGQEFHGPIRITDLSPGGMRCEANMPLDVGTEVQANINAVQFGKTFWVKGEVIRSAHKALAVRFIEGNSQEIETLLPH